MRARRALGLVQQVTRGAAQDHGAGVTGLAAAEADHRVLSYHNLIDEFALSQRDQLGLLKYVLV